MAIFVPTWPYLVIRGDMVRVEITLAREVDAIYWHNRASRLVFFTQELPVAWSHALIEEFFPLNSRHLKKKTARLVRSFGLKEYYAYQEISLTGRRNAFWNDGLLGKIQDLLKGRLLYLEEIGASLKEKGIRISSFWPYLQVLLLQRKIFLYPSLSFQGRVFYCNRCGGNEVQKFECTFCQKIDFVCTSCQIMGESRLCRPLLGAGLTQPFPPHNSSFSLKFSLSPFQSRTAKRLQTLITKEKREKVLFFAVCGAGKTEITFPTMDSFLKEGRPVLLTLPRQDVVHQLGERMKEAFYPLKVVVLTGSSSLRYPKGILVVATTHQVLRFYHYFHLVILDEFDAFPYSQEPMLDYGVKRSLVPGGQLIYMSATPGSRFMEEVRKGDWGLLKLPLRFHQKPLAEPELLVGQLEEMMKGRELHPELFRFLYQSLYIDKAQVFLFVPTKKLTEKVKSWLLEALVDLPVQIDAVHSSSLRREEKIFAFFRGQTKIMVTTTILERGITVPRCNVLVLFASYEAIFSSETLIQLSGRTGRSLEYPDGRVLFVGEKITSSMEEAKRRIEEINRWARERGLFIE